MGLQYFSLNSDSFQGSYHQRSRVSIKHKTSFAFNLAMLSAQLFGILFAIRLEQKQQQDENVKTGLTVHFATFFYMLFVAALSIVYLYLAARKSKLIFLNFDTVLEILANELHENFDYKSFTSKHNQSLILMTFAFVMATIGNLTFIFQFNRSNVFL